MAWFDNLLNHFALYPAHLFALLFVMALSKSTVLISVLPPASVMLLAGIGVSQGSMHPAGVACRGNGGNGGFGAELPYWPADGAHPAGHAFHV
jgi:membrane protein DedA with SNARE-associated domain